MSWLWQNAHWNLKIVHWQLLNPCTQFNRRCRCYHESEQMLTFTNGCSKRSKKKEAQGARKKQKKINNTIFIREFHSICWFNAVTCSLLNEHHLLHSIFHPLPPHFPLSFLLFQRRFGNTEWYVNNSLWATAHCTAARHFRSIFLFCSVVFFVILRMARILIS